MLGIAVDMIENNAHEDDPTVLARERWSRVMAAAALRLFDEYAPLEPQGSRDMLHYVKARFFLDLAVNGRGKSGRALYEKDLGIVSPDTVRARKAKAPESQ